jgi:hypothetical protein
MTLTDEIGTHEFEEEFTFNGVEYFVEGTITNTEDIESCERGFDRIKDGTTEIELLSVLYGEDCEHTLTDQKVLEGLENELYNY